jgi:hypothetical protein
MKSAANSGRALILASPNPAMARPDKKQAHETLLALEPALLRE